MTDSNAVNPLNSGIFATFKRYTASGEFIDFQLQVPDPNLSFVIKQIHYKWVEAKKYVGNKNFDSSIETIKEITKHGEFLSSLFLLIERILSFEGGSDPINAWNECVADLELFEIIDVVEGVELANKSWTKGYLRLLRCDLKALKNNNNPFLDKKLKDQVIRFFIDRALYYKTVSKPFYSEYWKPFLHSFSTYISDIDKNPDLKRAFIEQNPRGTFYTLKMGSGKSPSSTKKFKLD